MNTVCLIGTLTKDPEIKEQKGVNIGNFSVALNENYTSKEGEKIEKTHYFDVVSFGKNAENIEKFFKKGSRIAIRGKLNQERWEDKESKKARSRVVIYLDDFTFIDRKGDEKEKEDAE